MRIVCGLDVHNDTIFLCIMSSTGEIFEKKYGVLTNQLEEMRDLMLRYHVQEVGMESTSVYWVPVWRILEPHFKLKLINPYFIKQLPGHKSDVKDAQWIAECMMKELVKEVHGRIINRHSRETIIASLKGCVTEADIDIMAQLKAEFDISWAGLKPRNDQSNKTIKSRRITHGNRYLRRTIIQCAWGTSRTKGCFFSRFSYHQTQVRKKEQDESGCSHITQNARLRLAHTERRSRL